ATGPRSQRPRRDAGARFNHDPSRNTAIAARRDVARSAARPVPDWRRAVSHGVAREVSPRREPWGTMRPRPKPLQERQTWGPGGHSFAVSRFQFSIPQPTADAVGHPLVASLQLFSAAHKNRFAPAARSASNSALHGRGPPAKF